MGILGTLFGWDQFKTTFNVVLASDMLEHSTSDVLTSVAGVVAAAMMDVQRIGSIDEALQQVSSEIRPVQMQFAALAFRNLGISPRHPSFEFSQVSRPYIAEWEVTERRLNFVVQHLKEKYGLEVKWPGSEQRVDFHALLAGVYAPMLTGIAERARRRCGLTIKDRH